MQTELAPDLPFKVSASVKEPSWSRSPGVHRVNPLTEPNAWDALVACHSGSTIFHTSAWARVLHGTYGHVPHYWVRSGVEGRPGLLPCMEVNSPWTGRRGVCLPFTDECPALGLASPTETGELFDELLRHGRACGWKHVEIRGGSAPQAGASPSVAFHSHRLRLGRSEAELLAGLEGSVRRGIRKAEDAGLVVEEVGGLEGVQEFYRLHCQTRRRHGVPPQPFRFFEMISQHVLDNGLGEVLTVRRGARRIAAAIFLRHGRQVIYKFGASDYAAQALRPNNLLMWEAIKRYAGSAMDSIHFGRTSLFAGGLRRFKRGFGCEEGRVEYFRFDLRRNRYVTCIDRSESWMNSIFRCLPGPVLRFAGRRLYPHLA